MPIALPKKPDGGDYEDLVAACSLAMGYFIESNLHLREDTTEILEFDVFATSCMDPNDATLIEAKSGQAGFADLFKVSGWLHFLGFTKGCMVRTRAVDPQKAAAVERVRQETGIRIAHFNLDNPNPDPKTVLPKVSTLPDDKVTLAVRAAWYGRIGHRICLSAFNSFAKSESAAIPFLEAVKAYRWAIEQSFFQSSPLHRVRAIYDAYQATPGVTGQLIEAIAPGDANKRTELMQQAWSSSNRRYLQYLLAMENSARLSIIKNALLRIVQAEEQEQQEPEGFDWNSILQDLMPAAFQAGLGVLRTHPYRFQIPFLFQLFVEVFGGWYALNDQRDIELLGQWSGVPANEVVNCLNLYDVFFPTQGGWFVGRPDIRFLKLLPASYRGTGAFLRKTLYGIESFDGMFAQSSMIITNWHNALYDILEGQLQVH